MTDHESQPYPTWEEVLEEKRIRLDLKNKSDRELSDWFAQAPKDSMHEIHIAAYALEAADRLARADRLRRLIGLLAPAGTAPRTALEQLYIQSETSAEESPIVLDLRNMLKQHWGEWTPALQEAEGLPPRDRISD